MLELDFLKRHGSQVEEPSTSSGYRSEGSSVSSASRAVYEQKQRALQQRVAELERAAANRKLSKSDSLNSRDFLSQSAIKRRDDAKRNNELRKLLQQAQELDLAFLVDATGSMSSAIVEVKTLVPQIATRVKAAFPKLKLRVSFVPYRDYAEHERDDREKCDFTNDFEGPKSTFVTAVEKVEATGGGDTAEDVFSGLERAATLTWVSKTRVLIHIGDAPCHGTEFHNGVSDRHPKGDSKGRDITKLLEKLRYDCQVLTYMFCHVNDSTKKMLSVFQERGPQGGWIQEQKLANMSQLLEAVVSASTTSISESGRVFDRSGPTVSRYVHVDWKKEVPDWKTIKKQQAVQYKYKQPASLTELFSIIDNHGSFEIVEVPATKVQIARKPFTDTGKMRWPYHALVHWKSSWTAIKSFSLPGKTKQMVVKRFKDQVGDDVIKNHTNEAYSQQMEVQTVASFMAKLFNAELSEKCSGVDYKPVQFTTVSVLRVGLAELTYYNMEALLEGEWIRYSNNLNYVNTKEYAATLHAFTHWTYQRSEGRLMVTDLQGVQVSKGSKSMGKKSGVFMLCDPAIHCKFLDRYARTKTNWSTAGMESFFETHECNDICRCLDLKPGKKCAPDKTWA